ncbi:MAG TPA: hypothetical protein VGF97_00945 [Rhizomicrobium sp.]|jgi:hypothetical protein
MSSEQWLLLVLLGGLLGGAGQSARVIVGLKKLNDEATAKNTSLTQLIDPSRLIVSLLIGFVAGVLAAVSMVGAGSIPVQSGQPTLGAATLLAFAAAGYAGTDFIEGIMSRFLPSGSPRPASAGNGAADRSVDAYRG